MEDLIERLQVDRILVHNLRDDLKIEESLGNWKRWKNELNGALERYDKKAIPFILNWCIEAMQRSTDELKSKPLDPEIVHGEGTVMHISRPEMLENRRQQRINSFQSRIDYCKGVLRKEHSKQIKRMVWQAGQQELAELFIELWKKGWISEIEDNAIKLSFTQSHTIDQILKSRKKTGKKEDEFPQVYTNSYTERFECIPINPDSI